MSGRLEKVKMRTSDGVEITVDRQVAERSIIVKNLIEDLDGDKVEDQAIPVPNVR